MELLDIFVSKRKVENQKTRSACRGLVVRDGLLLLSYEVRTDQWFLPGGGMEEGETPEDCCIRELAEETGFGVRPTEHFLTIREHCGEWLYITHYFICTVTGQTERQLTEGEQAAGLEPRWLPVETALELFGKYEEYSGNPMKLGAYRREFTALMTWKGGA